jgi:DICT domain-containing protein
MRPPLAGQAAVEADFERAKLLIEKAARVAHLAQCAAR